MKFMEVKIYWNLYTDRDKFNYSCRILYYWQAISIKTFKKHTKTNKSLLNLLELKSLEFL